MNKARYTSTEIKEGIYYIGTLDYGIEIFDIVMRTKYGTTYNSYLVKGTEKTALVEITKEGFFDGYCEQLSKFCDINKIDYVVVNHTEPDHSGSLFKLFDLNPNLTVVGSGTAIKFLNNITNKNFSSQVVADGDMIDLGGKTLRFVSSPMLHWPDTMFTYCEEEKVLFTCDFFGCHYCSDKVFNDVVEQDPKCSEGFEDAYKYYFDGILGPFKEFVLAGLNRVDKLDVEVVCPGHGPVIRKDLEKYKEMYRKWSASVKFDKPKVSICYVSAYGYTREMAKSIEEGIKTVGGIDVKMFDLVDCDENEMLNETLSAQGILIGTPTIVGDTLPPVHKLLSELNPIIHRGKIAGAFGSYGWSGEGVPNVMDRFKQLRFNTPADSIKVCFKPTPDDLENCFEFGETFASFILNKK